MESIYVIIKTIVQNPVKIKSISQAKQVHAQIIKSFPTFNPPLLPVYSKLNLLPESLILFNTFASPPLLAWKSIIKCYSSNGYFLECLNSFVQMRALGNYPDHNVFPSVLKSCTHLMYFKVGESVHACVIRLGLEFDMFTGNALLGMYSKLQRGGSQEVFDESPKRMTTNQTGSKLVSDSYNNYSHHKDSQNHTKFSFLNQTSNQERKENETMWVKNTDMQMRSVKKVFETMPERDVVSYNTLILGYTENNMYDKAMMMIREMGNANLKPDAFTLSNILPIIAEHMDIWKGKAIHGYTIRHRFDRNEFIVSGLTNMYASCNMVEDSYNLFCSLPIKDGVLWDSITATFVQNGLFDEGLSLFKQMLAANVKPIPISFSTIIPACAHLTTLPLGQQLHGYIIRHHFEDNIFISSSLINMYAKCGTIKTAHLVFNNMKQQDLVSWTAMIMGYALHGHAHDAISLFGQMEIEGFRPNSVAFVAVLTACSHAGMVDEGLKLFSRMVKHYNIEPGFEHYACMADLLGRAGRLEEAFEFICGMPKGKTFSMWLPLLAACRVHKNVELAEKVNMKVCDFDGEIIGWDVMLSNMYSCVGRYKDAARVRSVLSLKGSRKKPGCSWIRIGKKVHGFVIRDESHLCYDGIMDVLDVLLEHMKKEGYVEGIGVFK